MKEFKKYIIQGIGISIGFIITSLVCWSILGIGLIAKNVYQQRQVAISTEPKNEQNKLSTLNLSSDELSRAMKITKDGSYSVKVTSGSGDVKIYDMVNAKHVTTLVSLTENKGGEFEGKAGYIVIPQEGIKIKCKRK